MNFRGHGVVSNVVTYLLQLTIFARKRKEAEKNRKTPELTSANLETIKKFIFH